MPDGSPRLQLVIDLAQAEVSDQFAGAVGRDGQAIGILLFDGALAGSLIAAATISNSPVGNSWAYPLAGLVISAAFAFAAVSTGGLESGPKLSDFLTKIQELQGIDAIEKAQAAAVDDLLTTIATNRGVVQKKAGRTAFALVFLAFTFVAYSVYIGRDVLGRLMTGTLGVIGSHRLGGLVLILVELAFLVLLSYAREG